MFYNFNYGNYFFEADVSFGPNGRYIAIFAHFDSKRAPYLKSVPDKYVFFVDFLEGL